MLGLSSKPVRTAVAYTALLLILLLPVAGSWHNELQDRDCPVCQTAHLPLVAPAPAPPLTPPAMVEHRSQSTDVRHDPQVFQTTHAPRAPPQA